MPEADTSSPASADIGALLTPPKAVTEGLATLGREHLDNAERTRDNTAAILDMDQYRANKAYEATGVGPDQLQPWNEQEQRRKFSTEPLEAFGSLGSVFGLLASAFVHAPMESGLNASAAAMNAIKAGDDQAYERAHTAWKENMDLAVKRHNMMRESYSDAITLMKTNLAAGEAKLTMEAARYGDKKIQLLLENGMSEEVYKLMDARNKSITGAMDAFDKITEHGIKTKTYDGIAQGIDAAAKQAETETGQPIDPMEVSARKLAAFNRVFGASKESPAQQIMGTYFAQHPMATAEEAAKFAVDNGIIHKYTMLPDAQVIEALKTEHEQAGKPPPTADEIATAVAKARNKGGAAGGNTALTVQRQNAAAADAYAKKLREDNPTMNEDEIQKKRAEHYAQLNAKASSASGNQIDWMKGQRGRISEVKDRIDEAEALLKKHNAITGLGGRITRPGEIVTNWFGGNQTDRARFESIIAEIKEFAPRLLNESKGRPLASEAENIDKIVRGTKAGDTTANTARQLLEVKKTLERFDGLLQQRIEGGAPNTPAEKPASNGKKPWDRDPVVKPVSELEPAEVTA